MSERSSFPSSFRRLKTDFNNAATTGSSTAGSSLFRDSSDPEEEDPFFTDPIFSRSSRLRSRLGESVFDSFPRRSSMRTSFPSAFDSSRDPFAGSRWHHPSWVEDELRRSRGSSPSDFRRSPTPPSHHSGSASPGTNQQQQQSYFARKQDGGASRGFRESSSQTSRASTPGSDSSWRSNKGHSDMEDDTSATEPGLERHASVSSKVNAKTSYSAQRQPKVHHIPIRVEPREDQKGSKPTSPPINNGASGFPNSPPPMNSASTSAAGFQNPVKTSSSWGSGGEPTPSYSSSPNFQRKARATPPNNAKTSSNGEKSIPVRVETDAASRGSSQPCPDPKTDHVPMQTASPSSPPPQPPKSRPTPMDAINVTLRGVEKFRPVVEDFNGRRGDKDYLYLDEMLTRLLIRLDYVETDGNPELRQARRAAIMKVNELIHAMEGKVAAKEKVPLTEFGNSEEPLQTSEISELPLTESGNSRESQTESRNSVGSQSAETPQTSELPSGDVVNEKTLSGDTSTMDNAATLNYESMQLADDRDPETEIKLSEDSGIVSSEETNLQSDDTDKPDRDGAKSAVKSDPEPKKFKTVANVQLLDSDAIVPSTSVIDGISETSENQPN